MVNEFNIPVNSMVFWEDFWLIMLCLSLGFLFVCLFCFVFPTLQYFCLHTTDSDFVFWQDLCVPVCVVLVPFLRLFVFPSVFVVVVCLFLILLYYYFFPLESCLFPNEREQERMWI